MYAMLRVYFVYFPYAPLNSSPLSHRLSDCPTAGKRPSCLSFTITHIAIAAGERRVPVPKW